MLACDQNPGSRTGTFGGISGASIFGQTSAGFLKKGQKLVEQKCIYCLITVCTVVSILGLFENFENLQKEGTLKISNFHDFAKIGIIFVFAFFAKMAKLGHFQKWSVTTRLL